MRPPAPSSQPASAGRSRCGPRTTRVWKPSLSASPRSFPGYDFKLLDNMMIFDPKVITNPAGVRSVEWLKTLKPEFVKMDVPTFKQ